jgi:hypothetical protein
VRFEKRDIKCKYRFNLLKNLELTLWKPQAFIPEDINLDRHHENALFQFTSLKINAVINIFDAISELDEKEIFSAIKNLRVRLF